MSEGRTSLIPALSKAQRRHLIELLPDDPSRVLFWKMTYGEPQHRSAVALQKKGLIVEEGSILTNSGGFRLTTEGRRVAALLKEADRD